MVYVGVTGFFSLLLLINKRRKHSLGFPRSVSQTVKILTVIYLLSLFFCQYRTATLFLFLFTLLLKSEVKNTFFLFPWFLLFL